jgi:hypothetical protein
LPFDYQTAGAALSRHSEVTFGNRYSPIVRKGRFRKMMAFWRNPVGIQGKQPFPGPDLLLTMRTIEMNCCTLVPFGSKILKFRFKKVWEDAYIALPI